MYRFCVPAHAARWQCDKTYNHAVILSTDLAPPTHYLLNRDLNGSRFDLTAAIEGGEDDGERNLDGDGQRDALSCSVRDRQFRDLSLGIMPVAQTTAVRDRRRDHATVPPQCF